MSIVTGFTESFEPQDEEPVHPLLDYIQTLDALEHNILVAENVFSRAAKKTLRKVFPDSKLRKASESQGSPLWITENNVVFELGESSKEELARMMAEIVENLAKYIHDVTQTTNRPVVMIDALRTQVMEVGKNHYRFYVKQKWTIDRD